jgi:hypothetical protein
VADRVAVVVVRDVAGIPSAGHWVRWASCVCDQAVMTRYGVCLHAVTVTKDQAGPEIMLPKQHTSSPGEVLLRLFRTGFGGCIIRFEGPGVALIGGG